MKTTKSANVRQVILTSSGWEDYELIDSGNLRKLERFGAYKLERFEPQAVWKPALPAADWQQACASFRIEKGSQTGAWQFRADVPKEWPIGFSGLVFQLRLRNSRHIGIFPEQCRSWLWIEERVKNAGRDIRILNLFGYTGIASLFAARAGAAVTHIDASRSALKWAQFNRDLNGLESCPIRWLVDDAAKFVEREARRGVKYDAIILDPPKFGRGPGGETWKFEKAVPDLLQKCSQILSHDPLFIYLTAYDVQETPVQIGDWLAEITRTYHGQLEYGWTVQQERSAGRKINQSMFARWYKMN